MVTNCFIQDCPTDGPLGCQFVVTETPQNTVLLWSALEDVLYVSKCNNTTK